MNPPNALDLTSCDLEPIHIPGSIQPYGIMLVADAASGRIVGYAGTKGVSPTLLDKPLQEIVSWSVEAIRSALPRTGIHVLGDVTFDGILRDAIAYASGAHIVVELTEKVEGTRIDAALLAVLDTLDVHLERAQNLTELAAEAARIFQRLTGYGRVMVYRFVDEDAGVVLGESTSEGLPSFMHHHFPASDIPRQARALYVRNRVRVIADVHYEPAPITSASSDLRELDLSDSTLRSVSPVHLQYLKNMGVAASASMSIVKDGMLWGLIACHHHEKRELSLDTRIACQSMASNLARLIKVREDNELYRERVRLRSQEDAILTQLGPDISLNRLFAQSGEDLAKLLGADGFAAVQGGDLYCAGKCPDDPAVRAMAEHVRVSALAKPVATRQLSKQFAPAAEFTETASGLLAVTMSTEVPTILMWYRAEQLQTVKWAGNPHKDVTHDPSARLTPRSSFEEWAESVQGRARDWTLAETESASRLVRLLLEARNNSRIRELNTELTTTLRENEILLEQRGLLLKEVNHRVQNSLSLVGAFLRMQARAATEEVRTELEEAQKRLLAVSLAHRRLYLDNSVEIIDLSRYLTELMDELTSSLEGGWRDAVQLDLSPVLTDAARAVSLGLVANELLTNAVKYAYEGRPGPVNIRLEQHRETLRLIVADRGPGMNSGIAGTGFGSKMLRVLMHSLEGSLEYEDNHPGVRAIVTAAIRGNP
ncbi:histidine kinase dimerization/phosphoacceptor domain -containing protein [Devosia sp. SD17-2]|uniref:histidine kinase dimerization/phosphoacceptor domain -containing protein n=1 Tax=Devosia sp. SD17-2 TaxID=2976459 RepID=UPI0023D7FF0E|nr:histidine kinase dimerization/phosphoacceptor domain -containing protein [Devosia sp. SD17-2]WEJ32606.1 GAF domain-containing protein [Devosia sp. SD17-2]